MKAIQFSKTSNKTEIPIQSCIKINPGLREVTNGRPASFLPHPAIMRQKEPNHTASSEMKMEAVIGSWLRASKRPNAFLMGMPEITNVDSWSPPMLAQQVLYYSTLTETFGRIRIHK